MDFLKKWMGCIISFIAGVCGLALSACTGMVASGSIDASALGAGKQTVDTSTKAFKVLTDSDLYTEAKELGIGGKFMFMKVFAIITLIVAVLLIAYSVVMLLKNLNVIKSDSKAFGIVGICLVALLLIATIGLMISSSVYADAMTDATIKMTKALMLASGIPATALANVVFDISIKVGVYQIAMLIVSVITVIAIGVSVFLNRKQVEG